MLPVESKSSIKPLFLEFCLTSIVLCSVQMLASSNVNVSVLGQKYEFFERETTNINVRRNYLYLFDQATNREAVKMDVSLGVSLVDRDAQDRLQGKLQREHPSIPGARMTNKEDKGALQISRPVMREQDRTRQAMAKP